MYVSRIGEDDFAPEPAKQYVSFTRSQLDGASRTASNRDACLERFP